MVSPRAFLCASTLFAICILAGCSSKQEKALEQAKEQAAKTGQPQQVVSVDQNGATTTTTVQPAAAGQSQPTITTTTAPAPVGQPKPAASAPVVSAVPQPPAPVNVTIPAGTTLAIRIDQTISVKSSHPGDSFTGEVTQPIIASDSSVLVPKDSRVRGVVDAAHKRGHFKGASILELRLTAITLNGQEYPLRSADLSRSKMGKGKRSAAFIGGGSGLGMLVGGVATGGVGLLVGGLVGGGAGTAAAGLTGNRDITIPAETVVNFRLAQDLIVQEQAQ